MNVEDTEYTSFDALVHAVTVEDIYYSVSDDDSSEEWQRQCREAFGTKEKK